MGKTEVPGIYKDSKGVLINKDNDALSKYKMKRNMIRQKDNRINTMESEIRKLSENMEQIKSLLKKLTKE